MPAYRLVIAPAAQADLRDIYQHGLHHWGKAQSFRYIAAIKEQMWALTEHPQMGTERPELLAGARCLPIQSHCLFYRLRDANIEIIRILHGRQDPHRQIK